MTNEPTNAKVEGMKRADERGEVAGSNGANKSCRQPDRNNLPVGYGKTMRVGLRGLIESPTVGGFGAAFSFFLGRTRCQ